MFIESDIAEESVLNKKNPEETPPIVVTFVIEELSALHKISCETSLFSTVALEL